MEDVRSYVGSAGSRGVADDARLLSAYTIRDTSYAAEMPAFAQLSDADIAAIVDHDVGESCADHHAGRREAGALKIRSRRE